MNKFGKFIKFCIFMLITGCVTPVDKYRVSALDPAVNVPRYSLEIFGPKTEIEGALLRSQFLEVLEKRLKILNYCYEDSLAGDPNLEAQGAWMLSVNKSGRVTGVKFVAERSTLKDNYLRDCVNHHLARTQFPASIEGNSSAVIHLIFAVQRR